MKEKRVLSIFLSLMFILTYSVSGFANIGMEEELVSELKVDENSAIIEEVDLNVKPSEEDELVEDSQVSDEEEEEELVIEEKLERLNINRAVENVVPPKFKVNFNKKVPRVGDTLRIEIDGVSYENIDKPVYHDYNVEIPNPERFWKMKLNKIIIPEVKVADYKDGKWEEYKVRRKVMFMTVGGLWDLKETRTSGDMVITRDEILEKGYQVEDVLSFHASAVNADALGDDYEPYATYDKVEYTGPIVFEYDVIDAGTFPYYYLTVIFTGTNVPENSGISEYIYYETSTSEISLKDPSKKYKKGDTVDLILKIKNDSKTIPNKRVAFGVDVTDKTGGEYIYGKDYLSKLVINPNETIEREISYKIGEDIDDKYIVDGMLSVVPYLYTEGIDRSSGANQDVNHIKERQHDSLLKIPMEVDNVTEVDVRLMSNGGKFQDNTTSKDYKLKKGSLFAVKDVPYRVDHKLLGWTVDEAGTKLYDFANPVTSSMVLYAKWEKIDPTVTEKYDVVFDLRDGRFTKELEDLQSIKDYYANGKLSLKVNKNSTVKLKLKELGLSDSMIKSFTDGVLRTNYRFRGWKLLDNSANYSIDTPVVKNVTVYADWLRSTEPSKDEVKVNLDSNGGEFKNRDTKKTVYVKYGERLVKRDLEKPTRKGYDFLGWTEDKKKEKLFDFDEKIYSEKTLYAVWEREKDTDTGKDRDKDRDRDSGIKVVPGVEDGILNRKDHFGYIKGYEDLTVRPEANLTREETAMVFYRILDPSYRKKVVTKSHGYKDVNKDRWSEEAIATLTNAKILTGYEDGSFKPTEKITRAELATVISKFTNTKAGKTKLTDIGGHWANEFIRAVEGNGWMQGYEDSSFKPNNYIKRNEFVKTVNRVLGRNVLAGNTVSGTKEFKDLKDGTWYYLDMVEAINGHEYIIKSGVEIWLKVNNIDFK